MDSEFLSRLNPNPQSPLNNHYKKKENLYRIEPYDFSYNFSNDSMKFLDSIEYQGDSRFIPSRDSTIEMKSFFFSPLSSQKKSPTAPDEIPSTTYDTATQPLKRIEKMYYDHKQSPIRASSPPGIDQRACSVMSSISPNYSSRRRRPQIEDNQRLVQRFPSEQQLPADFSTGNESLANSTVLLSSHPSESSLNSLNSFSFQPSESHETDLFSSLSDPIVAESPKIEGSSVILSSCQDSQSSTVITETLNEQFTEEKLAINKDEENCPLAVDDSKTECKAPSIEPVTDMTPSNFNQENNTDHTTPKSQRYNQSTPPQNHSDFGITEMNVNSPQPAVVEDLNDEVIPYLGNSFEEEEDEGTKEENKSVLARMLMTSSNKNNGLESFLTTLQTDTRPLVTEEENSTLDSSFHSSDGIYTPPRVHVPDRFEQSNPEMQPEFPSFEPIQDAQAEETSFYRELLKGELISSAKMFSKTNERKTVKTTLSGLKQKISRSNKISKNNEHRIDGDFQTRKKEFKTDYDAATPFSIQSFSPLKRELYSRGCTIPRVPFKVIEANSLTDDFYLNLVDWGRRNLIAIGLGDTVHLWNSTNGKTTELYDANKIFTDFGEPLPPQDKSVTIRKQHKKKKKSPKKHHKKKSLSLGSFEQLVQESLTTTDYEDESVSSLYRSFRFDNEEDSSAPVEELDESFIIEEIQEELDSQAGAKPTTPPKNPDSIFGAAADGDSSSAVYPPSFVSPRPKIPTKIKKTPNNQFGSPGLITSETKGYPVTSVGWSRTGDTLAVGKKNGLVQLYDVETGKKIRQLTGHKGRVGCISWNDYSTFSTGSRDHTIVYRDQRMPNETAAISRMVGHNQEVCGLRWSPDGKYLASGGNDNRLCIWDFSSKTSSNMGSTKECLFSFQAHEAAVKAIDWSPFTHGLLVTGGGTQDKCIRFWDLSNPSSLPTSTGENAVGVGSFHTIYTGSQVCNIRWSLTSPNELVSTHGYSQNQIIVWSYPWMKEIAILTGHTQRVLYLTLSPDGQYAATGAGDKTLRIWRLSDKGKTPEIFGDKEIR